MQTQPRQDDLLFVTIASTDAEFDSARILVESVRAFAGRMRLCPIWLFDFSQSIVADDLPPELGVRVIPAEVPVSTAGFELADKVHACAEAERLASSSVKSLVWLSPDNLVVNPPELYDLGDSYDVAVRPVHIKNIGLAIDEPPDDFWAHVFQVAGVEPPTFPVESFVDARPLRAYFNSHSYSVKPSVGLFRRWFKCFEALVQDQGFQSSTCSDELHRVFLHQAVLSALTASMIESNRIRVLPPSYCYPYNLQESIPLNRRAAAVNDLVSIVHEGRSLDPGTMNDIQVREPLTSWLTSKK